MYNMRLSLGGGETVAVLGEPLTPSARDWRKWTNGSKMWDPDSNKDCKVDT